MLKILKFCSNLAVYKGKFVVMIRSQFLSWFGDYFKISNILPNFSYFLGDSVSSNKLIFDYSNSYWTKRMNLNLINHIDITWAKNENIIFILAQIRFSLIFNRMSIFSENKINKIIYYPFIFTLCFFFFVSNDLK